MLAANVDTTPAILLTLLVVIVLLVVLGIHRRILDKHYAKFTNRTLVLAYVILLIILAAGILSILPLWGYDLAEITENLGYWLLGILETNIPRLIGTIIALFVAIVVYKGLRLTIFRLSRRPSGNERRKQTIAKISLSIAKYIIGILGLLSVLSIWGINVGPALAGLGILGLVIGLGAQQLIHDLISGFFIVFERHFDVGDWIEVDGFMGEVVDIGLKTTKVRNIKGELRIFNNGDIGPVSNFSVNEAVAVVDFSIAYKEDVQKAVRILEEKLPVVAEERTEILETPSVLGVTNLADSGVEMRILAKTAVMKQWAVERFLRQRIKEIFDEHSIEIPFPQVVVHRPSEE